MAGLYLALRGTAIMYYGEEVGMTNSDPKRKEDVKDPIGRVGWPKEIGRDGERTPMQWNYRANAGFTTGTPWLPVPPSYKTHNVATESNDPDSILNFYKRVLELRHREPALVDGDYVTLGEKDPDVLSYLRRYKDEAVLVVLNMSGRRQKISLDLSSQGFSDRTATTLVTTLTTRPQTVSPSSMSLEPFSVYIGRISKQSPQAK
jgi:alpha-glucosidase